MTPQSVSAVIPTYGDASYLQETLLSIERQTVPPDEVIVVDDGSEPPVHLDATGLPIRLLRIAHAGIAGARNAGVHATATSLVHICDHDDVLEPHFYESIIEMFASRVSVDVVHATCGFIGEEGVPIPGLLPGSPPGYETPEDTLRTLLRMNPIASVAAVFRREMAIRLHGFRSLDFVQDWDFWLRAAADDAQFAFLGETLAWHRIHSNQQSSKEKSPLILAESRRMLRTQNVPLRAWVTRERTISDLHLKEAVHHAAASRRLGLALGHLALAGPARPLDCLRAIAKARQG